MMTILVFVEMNGYNADKRDKLYTWCEKVTTNCTHDVKRWLPIVHMMWKGDYQLYSWCEKVTTNCTHDVKR